MFLHLSSSKTKMMRFDIPDNSPKLGSLFASFSYSLVIHCFILFGYFGVPRFPTPFLSLHLRYRRQFNPNYPGGRTYHPLSENRDFSGTEPLLDLRPVSKFKFVCCGPVEKNTRALYLSQFNRGGPTKFENTFFQIA